jgi:asparagine synthase (glutamine-hydrolysing)
MCGIAGFFQVKIPIESIHDMIDGIKHRGPDSKDVYINRDKCLALGHTRLSIVDIEGGAQPMTDVFGRYTIVFNGEIYGYRELKEHYSDYPYQTECDTELIFAMLYKHGQNFIEHLPGMFAFVIYDSQTDSLFGARDRFGEKPLFYSTYLGGFLFSSEIKALKSLYTQKSLTIDKRAISSYLERLYIPVNQCIYREIQKILPGNAFTYSNGVLHEFSYWEISRKTQQIDFENAVDIVYDKLNCSVKKQLIADVEVGAFLSGGIDSSLITAIASKHSKKQLSTYSFGFTGTATRNELDEARKHAINIGTLHHEFNEDDFDLFDEFLRMQHIFDEPFGDSSCIPMYIISKYAAQHGRVVLTGDGGDELFGGYSQWNNPTRDFAVEHQKSPWSNYIRDFKELIKITLRGQLGYYKLMERTNVSDNPYIHRHELNNVFFNWKQLNQMGLPPPYPYLNSGALNNSLSDVLNIDIMNYMPADILVKTDMAAMANGLELRAPFLDIDLAEYAISIPIEFKTTGSLNKKILRRIIQKYHPDLEMQTTKMGFGAPVEEWLKLNKFQDYKVKLKHNVDAPIYKYLDYNIVMGYFERDNYKTWLLMNLNAWLEHNM